jgi:hypothetical protein
MKARAKIRTAPLSLRESPLRSLVTAPPPTAKPDEGWPVPYEIGSIVAFFDTFRSPGLTISQAETDLAMTLHPHEYTILIIVPPDVKMPLPMGRFVVNHNHSLGVVSMWVRANKECPLRF